MKKSAIEYGSLLKSRGSLMGNLTHDFNNSLMAIIGYADLLLVKLPKDTVVRGYAEQIKQATEKCANLTQQMMPFGNNQKTSTRLPPRRAIAADKRKRPIG